MPELQTMQCQIVNLYVLVSTVVLSLALDLLGGRSILTGGGGGVDVAAVCGVLT